MSVASQANASFSPPSFRALRSVFKRLRKNRQNINTEKKHEYLSWLEVLFETTIAIVTVGPWFETRRVIFSASMFTFV